MPECSHRSSPLDSDFRAWHDAVYPRLAGHGVWMRGEGLNIVPAREFERRSFRLLIARLSTWRDTADSFPHLLLYALAAGIEDVFPDLAYLPPRPDLRLYAEGNVPWWLGIVTRKAPRAFDMIGISNATILELVNLPRLMRTAGLPERPAERLRDPTVPILILGGANAPAAEILMGEESPVDGIFVGESLDEIARLIRIARDARKEGESKHSVLARMEKIPGFVRTSGGTNHVPRRPGNVCSREFPVNMPVLAETPPVRVEISSGCVAFCRFCAESWWRKPYREIPAAEVVRRARLMKAATGADRVELYAFNFNTHSEIGSILAALRDMFGEMTLTSQRLDVFARDEALRGMLKSLGKTSLTFGIEGISGRMRRYLGKALPDGDMFAGLRSALSGRPRELKLFFIAVGLENAADFAEFEEMLRRIAGMRKAEGAKARVIVSITPLVRFPHTPLENEPAPDAGAMAGILERARGAVMAAGLEHREAMGLNEWRVSQMLARPQCSGAWSVLSAAVLRSDFVFYGSIPGGFVSALESSVGKAGTCLQAGPASAVREPARSERRVTGVVSSFLDKEAEKARLFQDAPMCRGSARACGSPCAGCGACRDAAGAAAQTGATLRRQKPGRTACRPAREDRSSVPILATLGAEIRGMPRKLAGMALASALMRKEPDMIADYCGFKASHWGEENGAEWIFGDDIFFLEWRRETASFLVKKLGDPSFVAGLSVFLPGWLRIGGVWQEPAGAGFVLGMESPFPFRPSGLASRLGLDFALRRNGESEFVFDLAAESLRRNVVMFAQVQSSGDVSRMTVRPGRRFMPEKWVQACFALPSPEDWVRVRISAVYEGRPSASATS